MFLDKLHTLSSAQIIQAEKRLGSLVTDRLPPRLVVVLYSKGRKKFIERWTNDIPQERYEPPEDWKRVLWGIEFNSPLMNAAGMFKNGEGYQLAAMQGAGAFLGGTSTWFPRYGNRKDGIHLPFLCYPRSGAASNWFGLPNAGDEVNAQRAEQIEKMQGCPLFWSVTGDPNLKGVEQLRCLVMGMKKYERAGVDGLELNESCPNTEDGKPKENGITERLGYVRDHFLEERTRMLPVVVKFSNDTQVENLPHLLDLIFNLGFDGVNFGNTSTNYTGLAGKINPRERKVFEFYARTFGGGVSGRPLKETSLELAARSVEYLKRGSPSQEFHVIRTGGIETRNDIEDSERAGISLNQWFTGYFEGFRRDGHNVYRVMWEGENARQDLEVRKNGRNGRS